MALVPATQITARELSQSSDPVLDRVQAGETIAILRDGKAVAIMQRPGPLDTATMYPFHTEPLGYFEIPNLGGPALSDDAVNNTLRGLGGELG